MMSIEDSLKNVKLLILDVDGVLTDGTIALNSEGEWTRRFQVRDGVGIKSLMKKGYEVAVITGAKAKDVRERIKFLGIPHFYENIVDKSEVLPKLLDKLKLKAENCAYIGDDIFDIPILKEVAFSATVPNAIDEALETALYVTKRNGGAGAVREICDLISLHGAYRN